MELPSVPFTGLRWKANALDASHLELLSSDFRPVNHALDAAGVQVFVWKAISPGHAHLSIDSSRPVDPKTTAPAKHVAISVEVVAGTLAPAPGADPLDPVDQGPTLSAVYQGTLPCGDCTGIAVDLTLFESKPLPESDKRSLIFVERRRYQGAPGGDQTIAGTGSLSVVHGTYTDPSMTVYVLNAPDGSTENFKVDGDRLVPLDALMVPIPVPAGRDRALHKVAASAP